MVLAVARSTLHKSAGRFRTGARALALLGMTLPCSPCVQAAPVEAAHARLAETSWRSFESKAAEFRVLLPAEPTVTSDSRRMWFGRIRNSRFRTRGEKFEFTVERHDIPGVAKLFVGSASILEKAKKGLLDDAAGRLISSAAVSRQGFPGRRFTYGPPRRPGWIANVLVLLAHIRLSLLPAARRDGSATAAHPARCVDSLHVLAPS